MPTGVYDHKAWLGNNYGYKHGGSRTKLYAVWVQMKERCNRASHPSYPRYGGRGILVCVEWLKFTSFRDWALASGYRVGLTIDRTDNSGNYESSNCKWIPTAENISKDAGKLTGKKVGQYTLDGNFVAEFPSAHEAGRQTGAGYRHINAVCLGKEKSAKSFIWRYA